MQPKPLAIGVFTRDMGGYYFGAMISGIHQVTRDAGVPLILIQSRLGDLRLPAFGAEHVAGWIVLLPMEDDRANLAALVASGVPVVTVAKAQYAQPPLTTVRVRFDVLGRAAAEYMLAVLRGERDTQPTRIYAPSNMLRRRSCGCADLEQVRAQGAQAIAAATSWQSALAEQLVALVCYPLALEPDTPPDQIWPGVDTLVAAVETVLQGQDSAGFAAGIDVAWQQAVALTDNPELLNATVALLEDATQLHLATALATRSALTALLRQLRMAMMRTRLAYEAAKNQYLTTTLDGAG